MRRLVGSYRPGLVSWTPAEVTHNDTPDRPARQPSGLKSRMAFCLDEHPPVLDAFHTSMRMPAEEIAQAGLFCLCLGDAEPQGVRTFFGPWDGSIAAPGIDVPGHALRLDPTPEPALEAERVRRILSHAPGAFIEAGWGRVPEFLVYGDAQAIRALPPGMVDVAIIPSDSFIRGDEHLAPLVAIHAESPIELPPWWAGLPVLVGPRLFWRSGWMEDSRTRKR